MRIEVTQEDIDTGVARDCRACPVALAVRRATGQSARVVVNADEIILRDSTTGLLLGWIKMPPDVAKFVADFDRGRPVSPISSELNFDPAKV